MRRRRRRRRADNGRVKRWRKRDRLPLILDALSLSENSQAVRSLADAFGGEPVDVRERRIGEPGYLSKRLKFASGGELILQDDALCAVLLHLTAMSTTPSGIDLSEWLGRASNKATLDDLKQILPSTYRFTGKGDWYFPLDGGYARFSFDRERGWKNPGSLQRVVLTVEQPGLECNPEDDDCPTCSGILVRKRASDTGIDIEETISKLAATIEAGLLAESVYWVKLSDLQPLHASGLMERVESQFTCTTCKRVLCLTMYRDAPATFQYASMNEARMHPLEAIPPVQQWGDEARIAEARDAMHCIDHRPGGWFLLEQHDVLYLDARYSSGPVIDGSVLIRLNESEVDAYQGGGHEYISQLATRIDRSSPYRDTSPYYERNLYRGEQAKQYGKAVGEATVNLTYIARQRQPK